jgi:hypothetical protein
MGKTSEPHVTNPDPLNGPAGKPGNVTTTVPVFGLAPTAPEAWTRRPTGHGIVFEKARPATVTAADGCPTGVTTTIGT